MVERRRGTESFAVAVNLRGHRPDRIKKTLVVRNCKSQTPTQSSSTRVLGFGSVATRSFVHLNEGEAALCAQAAVRTYGRKICRAVGARQAAPDRTIRCTRACVQRQSHRDCDAKTWPTAVCQRRRRPRDTSRVDERPQKAAHFQRTDVVQTVTQRQLQMIVRRRMQTTATRRSVVSKNRAQTCEVAIRTRHDRHLGVYVEIRVLHGGGELSCCMGCRNRRCRRCLMRLLLDMLRSRMRRRTMAAPKCYCPTCTDPKKPMSRWCRLLGYWPATAV
ncbi:hypothetical protein EXIGLDRAFT_26487 [Exidia glandulosa HHB12029]|uniref:Uncharacterized protein n=1 Tax=Exidia glandulosa HHB12029 TaxID=1314781 RepID=A0A165P7F9_EXIGL|nr:hypothetical protein EXIGLDRAFT_26487 [Exidia glandulosa HHB12029]